METTIKPAQSATKGRARRLNKNWLEDKDAVISSLLAEKNRSHNAYVNRPTDEDKVAFYSSRRSVQQQLPEMPDAWMTHKTQKIQGHTERNEWKNLFAAIRTVPSPTAMESLLSSAPKELPHSVIGCKF
nr:unnamed protein product [Spirometra erinaceieuropaei]